MAKTEFRIAGKPVPLPGEVTDVTAALHLDDKPVSQMTLQEKVIHALRQVHDPEIPVNIYDLGLIYAIEIGDDKRIGIRMTLTSPACPVADAIPREVRDRVIKIPEVTGCDVDLVWEPPWTKDRMSDEAKLLLGFL